MKPSSQRNRTSDIFGSFLPNLSYEFAFNAVAVGVFCVVVFGLSKVRNSHAGVRVALGFGILLSFVLVRFLWLDGFIAGRM